MAKPTAHVPKFGNWDSDKIPYTTYFENARKDKCAGAKIFNPNDPEENPDAFMPHTASQELEPSKQLSNDFSGDHGTSNAIHSTTSDKSTLVPRPQHKKHHSREDNGSQAYKEAQAFHPQTSGYTNTRKGESGSDKNNSDNSVKRSQNRSKVSKHSPQGSYGHVPSPQPQAQVENSRQDETHHRAASIPKFGGWDEMDPKSADGYTIIFSKVKEEKQIAATRLPQTPTWLTAHPGSQGSRGNPSSKSKICCCFSPAASE